MRAPAPLLAAAAVLCAAADPAPAWEVGTYLGPERGVADLDTGLSARVPREVADKSGPFAAGDRVQLLLRADPADSTVLQAVEARAEGTRAEAAASKQFAVKAKSPLGFQPNIIFILTDDQDRLVGHTGYTDEGSLASMPIAKRQLTRKGAFLTNYMVNTPICCPSRTEFFTGRYFHNVRGAKGEGCMHANTTYAGQRETGMFGVFTAAGYNTGVFGKTTNDQKPQLERLVAQRSAAFIDSPVDYNNYYGRPYFHLAPNGTSWTENLPENGGALGTLYQTTQLGNRSLAWLDTAVKDPRPFFLYLGFHAPHYPADPAPWYEHLWDNISAPVTPNYNLSCPDKTQHIRQNPPLTAAVKCWEDQHFRDRWASLRSVDEVIDALDARLHAAAIADKTYMFFTGDHGYKFGQWRVGTSKQHPYETDIRVPFLARGPGIKAGVKLDQLSGNVDLFPTFLELAGITPPADMDGHSMVPWLAPSLVHDRADRHRRAAGWRDAFLNEYESVGTYYNDHSNAWAPDGYDKHCGGAMPRGPSGVPKTCTESTGVGDGNCYFVDSTHSNSWRALRIINATHDWQYVEYDSKWAWSGAPDFQELYDVRQDLYQMSNIYSVQTDAVKAALHAQLEAYYRCRGAACP
eukprot:TRINITY_DN17967_c0_g1_i1.p1 TRINITY_DN17967_c0_g1~~TRINITY_DN17967_c0_g1_i1.p1  ORF type:complete len:668 (+),score=178.64 TRINITY_DN17967_c0_g1_i1:107-2005(+)